ncbi:serine protease inhibitor 2-like [Uranotaenia lowii]|uniref:serine protease inhibitor 2-like n=1 Tax=Uranotaenia lowii TaxID=190385 RepID=UPI00247A8CCA|nr:serine protease inhibitor 2-like [Uranotaenia lowii]XP_055610314.1 serine protease inhibitor 2-like [Uranotaenia lowii]
MILQAGKLRSSTAVSVLLFIYITVVSSESGAQRPRHQTNQLQQPSSQFPSEPTDPVPLSNDFDWKLVKEVFRHEQHNTIFSPFSVKLLLTLLHEASGENSTTRRELSRALAGSNLEKNRQVYQDFLESSTKENTDYEFNIGTQIFVDRTTANVTDAYRELVERCYKTGIVPVRFEESQKTAAKVNEWCSEITRGHLSDLVDEDSIKNAVMVIANVLFLKASWRSSFQEELSHDRPFQTTLNQWIEAPFMEQTDIYEYWDDQELQLEMLRLPYKGRHFSMIMVLPYANSSLTRVVESLTADVLLKLESKMVREEVVVVIPKYKFDFGTSLNEILQSLGISEIFSERASLPQLSGGQNSTLQVSKVLQKAGIEVNEKGTLAVVATEIQLVNKFGLDDSPTRFEANRPFLFYIKDEDSDAMLFVGKVHNPAPVKMAELKGVLKGFH